MRGKQRNRATELSLGEMLTIMVIFHLSPCKNFKYFYLMRLQNCYKEDFPKLISYNRFVQLMRSLFVPFCLLVHSLFGEKTEYS